MIRSRLQLLILINVYNKDKIKQMEEEIENQIVKELPFHSLIIGPTKSGKTKYLIDLLNGPFNKVFHFIILICPTYNINDTWKNFAQGDERFITISPNAREPDKIDECLKVYHDLFHDNKEYKVLIILDDCAVSSDVKRRASELVELAFSGRHNGISVWILTQKQTSITSSFRDQSRFIVSFNNNNREANDMLFREYGSSIEDDTKKKICQILKENDYSRICFFKNKYEVQIPNVIR